MADVRIRGRYETLERFGIAAERFPAFVSLELDAHDLDVVLFTVVLDGRGRHVIDGAEHAIAGPSFAVTRAGEKHGLITDAHGLEVVNVYLDTEAHRVPPLGPPLDVALAALLPWSGDSSVRVPQVALDHDDAIRGVLDLLVAETQEPGPGGREAMSALLQVLLVRCARAVLDHGFLPRADPARPLHAGIEAVRTHLDRTYLHRHTLEDLAARAHLERTYFSKLFAAQVGVTVTEYLLRLRVAYAMTRLRSTDTPIAEIATASGFGDLSHFGRVFRRYVGTSPRSYRQGAVGQDSEGTSGSPSP